MNKTIPAVAAAALAVYLDRAARRRHREHMQALRLYRAHASGDQEWLDAHVDEARECADRIVGVQCGQHEVTGER